MTPIKLIRHKRKCPSLLFSLFCSLLWLWATQIQLTTFLNWKKRKITQITVKALAITCKAVTLVLEELSSRYLPDRPKGSKTGKIVILALKETSNQSKSYLCLFITWIFSALPIPSSSKPIKEDLELKSRTSKSMEIVAGNSRRDTIVGSKISLVVLNQPSTSTSTMEGNWNVNFLIR